MNMLDKIPAHGNKPRWEAIDDCAFTLLTNGMLTDSEAKKVRQRMLKKCLKQGVKLQLA